LKAAIPRHARQLKSPFRQLQRNGWRLHPWWPGRLADPVFVAGAPRSGTTVFGQILGQAPDLLAINEARYIWTALDPALDVWAYRYPVDQGRLCWSAADVTPAVARRLAQWLALELFASQRRRLVEKMPENIFRLPWLAAIFPQARFIHLIRDGRDVALSLEAALDRWFPAGYWQASRHYTFYQEYAAGRADLAGRLAAIPQGGRNYPRCLLVWLCSVVAGRAAGQALGPERYFELRYETLIEQPAEALAAVGSFIGQPIPAEVGRFAQNTLRPDSLGKADPDPDLTAAIAGDMLEELGYAL
jgi:hypothetical protein